MKTIAATILATLLGASLALAHQTEGGSTEGLFGLKAEYVHALLNPLPVYELTMGALVLAAGLFVRSKAARNIGLVLIVLCATSAWPVLCLRGNRRLDFTGWRSGEPFGVSRWCSAACGDKHRHDAHEHSDSHKH
jgi:hypothetical protein